MSDPRLNSLLKWSVENSAASRDNPDTNNPTPTPNPNDHADPQPSDPNRGLTAETLAALLGGPSDADRMREAMTAILAPEVDLENKLIAFDNLEQLIENIDNANNMEALGLWQPLADQLANPEAELRSMAAWCVATAVQNNAKAQERALVVGVIPTLVHLAVDDAAPAVRKKAILALSSAVRNYQPGLEDANKSLPDQFKLSGALDASDMAPIDFMIQNLRDNAQQTYKSASNGSG